ncbi:MAG: hypothetical protein JRH08_08200 [Deltaproteobacteria bacterium]|nr:hypothetical protein [Deltaproteobacteria bacterium]MBW2025771.1 hypothetical protein [Deltaproteobacteria bacterium]MBW2125664.1 hypothetical protein [Deltaproteobacteria bacterium]
MEPRQFQYLAERLAEHGAYPAEFRSAISRAYYAAFHFGLNLLREMGFSIVENATAHEDVYLHLNNSGDHDLIAVASKIKDLRARRIHADYRLQRRDVEAKENAKMYVRLASRLMETIEKRCNSESRGQIIEAIQNWKNNIRNSLD